MKAATTQGQLHGVDIGRVLDIATEWPQAQPGESLLERQCGAILKARIDDAKDQGAHPDTVARQIRAWIVSDIGRATAANTEPLNSIFEDGEIIADVPHSGDNPLFSMDDLISMDGPTEAT